MNEISILEFTTKQYHKNMFKVGTICFLAGICITLYLRKKKPKEKKYIYSLLRFNRLQFHRQTARLRDQRLAGLRE